MATPATSPVPEGEKPPLEGEEILAQEVDMGQRFSLPEGRSLRQHAARGVIVNSLFQIGISGLGLIRRVGIAAFLTQSQYGFWGLIITTLITLSWLKQVGIDDKYVQQ